MDKGHIEPYALALAVAEGTATAGWVSCFRGFEGDSSCERVEEFKDDAGGFAPVDVAGELVEQDDEG
jgi:hypothetical protein